MKAIVQRVTQASVTVGEETVCSIGKGICVLVGITRKDTPKELDYMVRKILNLRVFEDDQGKRWNKSVMDKQYEVMCVSQFTLAVTMKGNKPDFHEAMGPEHSEEFYLEFLDRLRTVYQPEKIKDGKFGAYMQVHIQNDGPVTIPLETPASLQEDSQKQAKKLMNQKTQQKQLANSTQAQADSTSNTQPQGAEGNS